MTTDGRTSPLSLWAIALLALVAVATMFLARVLGARVLLWDVAWTTAAAAALLATVFARRRAHGLNRFRWTMWMAATGWWLAGQLAWNLYGTHVPASPNLGDVGWWGFAVCAMVGVTRSPVRSRALRLVDIVESLPLIAAALALTCNLLWHDASASPVPLGQKVAILCYPTLYVSAAVLTLRALLNGNWSGRGAAPLRLILIGTVVEAAAFSCWSERLLDGTYVPGMTWMDPSFVIGLLVIATGGIWAARIPDPEVTVAETGSRGGGRLPAVVFYALCAALVHGQFAQMALPARFATACGTMFCGGALVLRGHLLSRRLKDLLARERHTVAQLAEREAELARINRRLVEDSRHDPLTGMRNRRGLAYDLPRLEDAHRAPGDFFAVVVCDVDHFKAYNDRLGHLTGDTALRTVAGVIRGELRSGDAGYRFGGEELLIVLPHTGVREAYAVAERVRMAVAAAAVEHPEGIGGVVTVSAGVAAGQGDASNILARADAALYEAKRGGRNRTVAESEGSRLPLARRRAADEDSVPRQLKSMLRLSRVAASGQGVTPVLQALAETIRLEMNFEVVAVNLRHQDRDVLEVAVVLGDEEARDALEGSVNDWSAFAGLMRSEHDRCGAVWLPAGTDLGGLTVWDPAIENDDDPGAWDSHDMLLLPVRAADGTVLAVVSVDRPMSGRRPQDDEISVLMAVADHAGLALERALRDLHDESALREQSAELTLAAVMLLAETLDLRDPGTGRHGRTVGELARRTAQALALPTERVERIAAAGVLHDLGKLGIADAILYKPGALDEPEWREMKRHPEIGARILEHAGLLDIAVWVRAHHERVDGRGYPDGVPDGGIPLEAKILAVADAYEAMVADRPYRRGMPVGEACAELRRCAGAQFDPLVVEAFLSAIDDGAAAELSLAAA